MKILQSQVDADVQRALEEDIGSGDVTANLLPADLLMEAEIISREAMLVCGQPWVNRIFAVLNPAIQLDWLVDEGSWLKEPATLCKIYGAAKDILTGERSALNFLQTLSATATQTFHYLLALKDTGVKLLDTRKTLPGLRLAQKYAVACAGGANHRSGLYDAFLIKENHIRACGSIGQAIQSARAMQSGLFIEVEVETLAELQEALQAEPDRILLDNFTQAMLIDAVAMNKSRHCKLEASGGIDLTTVRAIAQTGVDYVSVGAITKSVRAIDLSLLIRVTE